VFDHPLEVSEWIAGVAGVSWHRTFSVRPTRGGSLSPIAQRGGNRLAIL
jgi:hypothetical protein